MESNKSEIEKKETLQPKFFILDVDGVFTDGKFVYTKDGKVMKTFGSDDHDALSLLKEKIQVLAVTGDKNGFEITKKRFEDMKIPLDLVSTYERVEWIREKFNLKETIYMGDGIFDPLVFREVGYSIAPANAFFKTKQLANFVTNAKGGEGAVAEACLHILEKFFQPFDLFKHDFKIGSGSWNKTENKAVISRNSLDQL
jgi:3-deoxy-D-manno-octulosonate 8-phosphate phosphatase (KDO 8-P phosphatase)